MKLLSGNKYKVIGIMSGTSLDGIDLAACEFEYYQNKWTFTIVEAKTETYNSEWNKKLQYAHKLSGEKLIELHIEYGRFIGLSVNKFIAETGFLPDSISSHGHTVFHQPEKHFTFQLGNGADIAATTNIPTVADFRTGDIALGGQGAPLVPVGDKLLFSDYEFCLNLGGFANISFDENNQRIAFDICPVNFVLNYFAAKRGMPYDKNGDLGRKGKVIAELLKKLNNIQFYHEKPPKSLGREWVDEIFFPELNSAIGNEEDKLRTIYEHIAEQISNSVNSSGKVLVTGGGAFNTFLIELLQQKTNARIILPDAKIINYKEALIFAFLGVLKVRDEINCLASVTGALRDSSSGIVFQF